MQPSVAVVRPYFESLRAQVFDVLGRAGIEMDRAQVLERGSSDEQALRWLGALDPDVVLLPFHPHRDDSGRHVDGIELAFEIGRAFGERCPAIIVPVSMASAPAAGLVRARAVASDSVNRSTNEKILLVHQRDLQAGPVEVRALVTSVRDHLRRHLPLRRRAVS